MRTAFVSVWLGLSCSTLCLAAEGDCEVLPKLAVSGLPGGAAFDGEALWVADFLSTKIRRIDPATGAVLATITGPGMYTGGLAWDGSALWAAPEQSGMLYRLDPATGAVLKSIPAPTHGQKDPNGSDLAWDGTALWHGDYGAKKLRRVDPADGTVLAELPSPGPQPFGLAMNGTYLVVSDATTDVLAMVDTSDGSVVALCVAPDTDVRGLAVDGDGVACVSAWKSVGVHKVRLPKLAPPWYETVCEGTLNSLGEVAHITPEGGPSLAAHDMTLTVGMVPDDFVLLLASTYRVDRPFRNGALCVGRPATMLGVARAVASEVTFDPFGRRCLRRKFEAGETWVFQCLYRDRGGPGKCGFGTSDAVTVTFEP